MNSKVNLIISFAEMLQKIANETKDTEYTQTFGTAVKALSSEDEGTTIFDVAYALHECDSDKAMPGSVFEYLKTVYQIGIDEGTLIRKQRTIRGMLLEITLSVSRQKY